MMREYIIGKIVEINKNTIVLENNYIGYKIYVPKANEYIEGKIVKLYLTTITQVYASGNKQKTVMFGFKDTTDRHFFEDCIIAHNHPAQYICCTLMTNCDVTAITDYITNDDRLRLAQHCTSRLANRLCDDLHEQYLLTKRNRLDINERILDCDLSKALRSLGYDDEQIL
jgi:Holliday junction resolvasome RuvABC DNA-binding subunit